MDRLPLSANKSNLLRLREELSFASDGMNLLDEKKEALLSHISALSTKSERVRDSVNQALQETYQHHREALLMAGRLACERAALAARADETVEVIEKSFMGVALPILRISIPKRTGPHTVFWKPAFPWMRRLHLCIEALKSLLNWLKSRWDSSGWSWKSKRRSNASMPWKTFTFRFTMPPSSISRKAWKKRKESSYFS